MTSPLSRYACPSVAGGGQPVFFWVFPATVVGVATEVLWSGYGQVCISYPRSLMFSLVAKLMVWEQLLVRRGNMSTFPISHSKNERNKRNIRIVLVRKDKGSAEGVP